MSGDASHPVVPGPIRDGPDADGFFGWTFSGSGFNATLGRILSRAEGADMVRVRIAAGPDRGNVQGALHGGFLLGFLDQALFIGPTSTGRLPFASAVTLSVSTQFVAAGRIGPPLDCLVEIVRETGRLLFLRGTMEQDGRVVLVWQATLSKHRKPAA